jgi:hypothetical protein
MKTPPSAAFSFRPKLAAAWASALLLALFVAGCGGGGGGGSAPRPPAPPPPLSITTSSVDDGVNGTAYSQTLAASGGTGTRTWSLTSSSGPLPDGLSLSNAGVISGTPTVTNTFDFTVQAQDSSSPPQTDTQALSIRIADPLSITTNSLADGEDNKAYNQTITATGGVGPYSWSIASGSLPAGLSLGSSTSNSVVLSGNPTQGGSFTFTVQVEDSTSPAQTASQPYTILVLKITTLSLPNAVENDPYPSRSFAVVGNRGTVSWTERSAHFDGAGVGALGTPCQGLIIDFLGGSISGTPVNPGDCTFTMRATDTDGRFDDQRLIITVLQKLQIATASLPAGTSGQAYDQTVQATGGVAPYTWSEPTDSFDADGVGVSLTPCEGLLLELSATGSSTTVSGTPVNPGACDFTLQIADSGTPQQTDSQNFTISVTAGPLVITTPSPSLPAASVNRTYLVDIDASGGTPPLTWSEPGGLLDAPATPCEGLTLNTDTGEISGTPVNPGTCGGVTGFTINVQDSLAVSDSKQFTIEVGPEPASGRNDTVATATDLGAAPGVGDPEILVTASISPYDPTDVSIPNPADNDFYKLTAPEGTQVEVEVMARRLSTFSGLDSVVEIVTDDGSPTGQRILGACQESGDDPNATTGIVSGLDGSTDTTPLLFDDNCINDDIVLSQIRDSRLIYKVQSGKTTFYVRVLDWRGDARPDFIYELHIKNAD